MIKASSYGKTLICKTCKAEILPIGESDYFSISNPNYSEYPVCPCLPWPGELRIRRWFKPQPGTKFDTTEADLKFMSEFYEDLPNGPCECGSASCGSNIHSSWCPAWSKP